MSKLKECIFIFEIRYFVENEGVLKLEFSNLRNFDPLLLEVEDILEKKNFSTLKSKSKFQFQVFRIKNQSSCIHYFDYEEQRIALRI